MSAWHAHVMPAEGCSIVSGAMVQIGTFGRKLDGPGGMTWVRCCTVARYPEIAQACECGYSTPNQWMRHLQWECRHAPATAVAQAPRSRCG
jgi:hypothetical protein